MITGTRKSKQRKSKVYGKNRVCAKDNCTQVLSQYNKQEYCFQHHKKKYGRVRGHELVR